MPLSQSQSMMFVAGAFRGDRKHQAKAKGTSGGESDFMLIADEN